MFYKLIQRGLPGWFPFNSLSVMQPMYTKDMNREIATEIGTVSQYTEDDPKQPSPPVMVGKHSEVNELLTNPKKFVVPFGKPFENFIEGRDLSHFMLAGDKPRNREQRNLFGGFLYSSGELKGILSKFVRKHTDGYISSGMSQIGRKTYHVDIIKEYVVLFLIEARHRRANISTK